MENKVKIKGKKVFLNEVEIGEIEFVRYYGSFYDCGVKCHGNFSFKWGGKYYDYDTSNFAWSADARRHIRHMIESDRINELVEHSTLSNLN